MRAVNLSEFFKVGWVKEPHGLKGELYIKLLSKSPEWLESLEEFVLVTDSGTTLYTVKKWRPHKQGIIILSPEISDRNQSESLKGHDFLISKDLLTTDNCDEKPFLIELKGFRVVDKSLGEVGVVSGFVDNGAQDLLEVSPNDGDPFLVPLVDELTLSIDRKKSEIRMDLPKGLIE